MKKYGLDKSIACLMLFFFMIAHASIAQDNVILKKIQQNAKFDLSSNNSAVLFSTGDAKFNDLFKAIQQAKHSIHLEYFNFRNDSISSALFQLLKQKADEGVEVRILFDGFGNASNNRPLRKRHVKKVENANIEIYEFSPLRFPYINHLFPRDHRKIVVIDGLIAYMGGMNVADYYIKGKKELGAWKDLHARVDGDIVNDIQKTFLTLWNSTTGQTVSGPQYYRGEKCANDFFYGLKKDKCSSAGNKKMVLVTRDSSGGKKAIKQSFLDIIKSAQDTIFIINPYFTLIPSVKKELKRALHRGVAIEIMISKKSDIPITPRVVEHTVHRLMKKGADVFVYEGGFHHSKMMIIDGRYSYFGSANLDGRSLKYDYENNLFIDDKCVSSQLISLFRKDQLKCFKLTKDSWKERYSRSNRFAAWFWQWLAPWL